MAEQAAHPKPGRLFRGLLLALTLLAAVGWGLTQIPLARYVPLIEQAASQSLHVPVHVRSLDFAVWPTPHLDLSGVSVGERAELQLDAIRLLPSLTAALDGRCRIERIQTQGGRVALTQLQGLLLQMFAAGRLALPCDIGVSEFRSIQLATPLLGVDRIDGELYLPREGQPLRLAMRIPDSQVDIQLLPQSVSRFAVNMQASNWAPPDYPLFCFDRLAWRGEIEGAQITLTQLSGTLAGVDFQGDGRFGWAPALSLAGKASWSADNWEEAVPFLNDQPRLKIGRLRGQGRGESHGESLTALFRQLKGEAHFSAERLALPLRPAPAEPVAVEQINGHLLASPQQYQLATVEAQLYGGKARGSAVWQPASRQFSGEMVTQALNLGAAAKAWSPATLVQGQFDSSAKFSGRLGAATIRPQQLKATGRFVMHHGLIEPTGLIQAVNNSLVTHPAEPLNFERIASDFGLDETGYHFSNLKVEADLFDAEGELNVTTQQALSGILDADLKGTGSLVSVPLKIGGTLSEPQVSPTGSTLAGAAVGSALLGPGLGTALGARVGGFFDRLFRQRKAPPAAPNVRTK